MPALLTVEDYLARVLTLGHSPRRVETVPLDAALGRVLAVDVAAAVSVPPFDNSAMDGYAVRAADLAVVPVSLTVVGESAAVSGPIPRVVPGSAVRVMTGDGCRSGPTRWCRSSRPISRRVLCPALAGGDSCSRAVGRPRAANGGRSGGR
ncbi:MAG: hypothetical protein R2703_04690 [Micropruina glycogenica]